MGSRQFKPRHREGPGRSFNGRKSIDMMYDTAWEKYRLRFLAENPRCYSCGVIAVVVDHLKPHKGDENLFKQLDNHIPLCKRCHDTVTTLFDRRYRIGATITPKIQWLQLSRSKFDLTFKVKVLPSYI